MLARTLARTLGGAAEAVEGPCSAPSLDGDLGDVRAPLASVGGADGDAGRDPERSDARLCSHLRFSGENRTACRSWAALTFGPSSRSSAPGLQPRMFMVTRGGYLVSRLPEVPVAGWTYHNSGPGFDSGVDVVSFTDGGVQRIRLFTAESGAIESWAFDDDFPYGGLTTLPAAPGGTVFSQTDVAAVAWDDAGTQRMAVAAVGTNGRACVWEGTVAAGFSAPWCSDPGWVGVGSEDVTGAAVGAAPWFGLRLLSGKLGGIRRDGGTGAWAFDALGLPPGQSGIAGSVVAWPSQAEPAKVEIAMAADSGALYTARIDPAGAAVSSWHALPAMPGGAQPGAGRTVLAATRYTSGGSSRTLLYVRSASRRLYRLRSGTGGAFGTWLSGTPGQAASPPDEDFLGCGAAAALGTASQTPLVYGYGGEQVPPLAEGATLQEFRESGFRDHVRYAGFWNEEIAVGDQGAEGTAWANESTASVGPILGISTAIRRDEPPPWQVVATETASGGDRWSEDVVLPVASGWQSMFPASLTDPYAVARRDGTYHHLVLEVPIQANPGSVICTPQNPSLRRMIYRRGGFSDVTTSTLIDGATVFLVQMANLDHGNLALTDGPSGTTAHVVYWSIGTGTMHWYQNDTVGTGTANLSTGPNPIPAGAAGVFTDAAETAYAWSGVLSAPWLCRLDELGACLEAGRVGGGALSPAQSTPDVVFAPAGPGDPYAVCPTSPGNRCFDTQEPFELVADAVTPDRLYAVYQGADPGGSTSVYFTMRKETDVISNWSPPVRVNLRPTGDQRVFIDPSITVDGDGTIVVTYSAADNPEPDKVEQYLAYSTNGGASFTELVLDSEWSPYDLPFHCTRSKSFLGEYRDGAVVGARAYHHVHASEGGRTVLRGRWASRWSVSPW